MTGSGRASTGRLVFGKDFLWGLGVSIVLLAAVFGTFMVEQGQLEPFSVTWQYENMEVDEWSGSVEQDGEPAHHGFTVDASDALVVRLDFELTWEEPTADRFVLEITSPNGTVSRLDQEGGQLEYPWLVQDGGVSGQVFFAKDEGEALGLAWEQIEEENRTAAHGDWAIEVELLDGVREIASGVEDPMATVANEYRLEATLTLLRPHV